VAVVAVAELQALRLVQALVQLHLIAPCQVLLPVFLHKTNSFEVLLLVSYSAHLLGYIHENNF
jgi:hypothetical protein